MVARALVGVQAEVVMRHGYEGDAGYAQAQVRFYLPPCACTTRWSLCLEARAQTTAASAQKGVSAGHAQVCLMEHAEDAVVTASIAAATTQLYARAGINLHEAVTKAAGGI